MSDEFLNGIMKSAVGALCQNIGWNTAHTSTIEILSDLFQRQFLNIAKRTHRYAEEVGRTDVVLEDVNLCFSDLGINVNELEEYVQNFDPVSLPYKIPKFPVHRPDHLNFLRPGSHEVLTRPVQVHEYMPPMFEEVEEEEKEEVQKVEEKEKEEKLQDVQAEKPIVNGPLINIERSNSIEEGEIVEIDEKPEEIVEKELEIEMEETEAPKTPETPLSPEFSPFSNLNSKSNKRLESPGENAALKRVRLMLEEEGHPLREITSVMMTSSGYLTSSREGRVPDTKQPSNRDFFEPVPVQPIEKKKKAPTMKEILEGVKKLDKEKENKDKGESSLGLFEKPDKILSISVGSSDKPPKEKKEKHLKIKLKEKGQNNKFLKSDKESKKLKIFKKKIQESIASKSEKKKLKNLKIKKYKKSSKDFARNFHNLEDHKFILKTSGSSLKKQKKKNKLFVSAASAFLTPNPQISPSLSAGLTPVVNKKLLHSPILPIVKKKRGRPKKQTNIPFLPPLQAMPGLYHNTGIGEPPAKIMKMRKKTRKNIMDAEMKSFVPEININIKPSSKDLSLLTRLPSQPGLIPFTSTPPVRITNHLPSSISITPTVSSTPMQTSPNFGNIPSTACPSVTITRIDMSSSNKLPTPYDNQSTPGIGPGIISSMPNHSKSNARHHSSPSNHNIQQPDSSSGITITPIVMENKMQQLEKSQQPDKPPNIPSSSSGSGGLAKLEEEIKTKDKRRKKDKREKKKKKDKKEKPKREKDKSSAAGGGEFLTEKISKEERKEKKEKSEKKKKKDRDSHTSADTVSTATVTTVPKLTLKLGLNSTVSTPIDNEEIHHPKKITIKPIEKSPSPAPELARFSPLVTRPPKANSSKKAQQQQQQVSFPPPPPTPTPTATPKPVSSKRGRPPKSSSGSLRGPGRPPKDLKMSQEPEPAGLVTETIGFYKDEQGNPIWICPACGRQDDGSPMIGCDTCDDWYHFECVGITQTPDENDPWFCKKCTKGKSKGHRAKGK